MHEEYYEAILQLRNENETIIREAIDQLGDALTTADEVRNGVDIYVKDQNITKRVAWTLRDKHGGSVSIDSTLHTVDKQSSEEVRRLHVSVRFPDVNKGDYIIVDDRLYHVLNLGKDVKVHDIAHDKITRIDYPDDYERVEQRTTRVVQEQPEIAVLHPDTYKQVTVQNEKDVVVQEKVDVVEHHGLWMV